MALDLNPPFRQIYDAKISDGGMTMTPLFNSNDDAQTWAFQKCRKKLFQVAGRICQVRQPVQHCCTSFPGELYG